ncbi:hypothetical protein M1L60_16015 [Actinoplanes sp. TRM 88003]|uniref:Uncharacterized protein n=1 Tax=Paractinoplanes aksuensis TaxID=2939490 RepID=A0ABT1DMR9_9ACTN|nr:hypothetical protein [Actinoplanes aksuensis]MCO8272100.1 hypothetical protein [Actinoplanes aksuensis]
MASGNGWYLIGPLVAVGLVGLLGAVFWRMGLQWTSVRDPESGLAIFGDREPDYGLLRPAAVTADAEIADEIRRRLGDAGIRATQTYDRDGRTVVLVFADQLEEARRLAL